MFEFMMDFVLDMVWSDWQVIPSMEMPSHEATIVVPQPFPCLFESNEMAGIRVGGTG